MDDEYKTSFGLDWKQTFRVEAQNYNLTQPKREKVSVKSAEGRYVQEVDSQPDGETLGEATPGSVDNSADQKGVEYEKDLFGKILKAERPWGTS